MFDDEYKKIIELESKNFEYLQKNAKKFIKTYMRTI
jgi:hypothetical protein